MHGIFEKALENRYLHIGLARINHFFVTRLDLVLRSSSTLKLFHIFFFFYSITQSGALEVQVLSPLPGIRLANATPEVHRSVD